MSTATAHVDAAPAPLLKIILIGDSAVGKSSLALRMCDNVFFEDHAPTLGMDFKYGTVAVDVGDWSSGGGARRGQPDMVDVKLQLWDTAGQETFLSLTSQFYRGCNGVVLCFDLTNRESYENLELWFVRLHTHINGTGSSASATRATPPPGPQDLSADDGQGGDGRQRLTPLPVPALLVGTKADIAGAGTAMPVGQSGSPQLSLRRVATEEAAAWAESHGMKYIETSARISLNVREAFAVVTKEMLRASGYHPRLLGSSVARRVAITTTRDVGAPAPRGDGRQEGAKTGCCT